MAYQQIAGGANGLIFYSFHDVIRTRKDEPDNWSRYWGDVKHLAAEIKKHEKIWLAADSGALKIAEPKDRKISVRTWRKKGLDYVLVSSGEDKPLDLNLSLPVKLASVKTLDGEPVSITGDNSVKMVLGPYGFAFFSAVR